MDHEVGQLAERERGLEDEELELMEEEEPIDVELATLTETAAALDADAVRLEAEVAASEVDLLAAVRTEEAARAQSAAGLPADLAERYERLRAHLGGRRRRPSGRRPLRGVPPDAALDGAGADPPAAGGHLRHVSPVRPHPRPLMPGRRPGPAVTATRSGAEPC